MAQRNRLVKLEDKTLVFEFEIFQAQFNKTANHFLKLSVQNLHRQDLLSQILLDVNNSGTPVPTSKAVTDTVRWDGTEQTVQFVKRKFKFTLPKGFCKNDKNYDVHLLIEAYTQSGKVAERSGQALFAIYPRTELPKANLHVAKGNDYYKYSGVLSLLRPLSRASTSMHCGRLSYMVAFREYLDPTVQAASSGEEEVLSEKSAPNQTQSVATQKFQPSNRMISPLENNLSSSPPKEVAVVERTIVATPPQETETRNVSIVSEASARPKPLTIQPVPSVHHEPDVRTQPLSVASSEPLFSEDSFYISVASTPPPDDFNKPWNLEKTMDTPAGEQQRQDAGSRTTPKRPAGRTNPPVKSPTLTSPRPTNTQGPGNRHVAKPGHEEIYIILHGATSLPSRSDGADPLPFATLKSRYDDKGSRPAQCATHATLQPTHSPTWEEIMTMEVPEDRSPEEELIITVSDSVSKEKLVRYEIAISNLVPFHPYHFEFVQPTKSIPSGIRLYATIMRKLSYLPRLQGFGFCGLEVTLRDFQHEIKNSQGALLAVARIVPDYSKYKESMLTRRPCPAGITTTTITFPSPNPSAFEVMKEHKQGFPQLTTPSSGGLKPQWDHVFMFSNNDAATMFGHNSALVLEFYPTSTTMNSVTWTIRSPVGFSTLLLDDELFQALTSDAGRLGVRVDDLVVQSSNFRTVEGPYPSVRLLVRLINTERPDTLAVTSDAGNLPLLDSLTSSAALYEPRGASTEVAEQYLNGSPEKQTQDPAPSQARKPPEPLYRDKTAVGGPPYERKKTRLLVQEDEFPPNDALQTILPDYALTENDADLTEANVTSTQLAPAARNREMEKSVDNHTRSLLDHQSQELSKYREAVKRMSNDIVKLRGTLSQLQEENALLRRELMTTQEVGNTVMDDIHRGVVSSQEVADKFVAVRKQLNKDGKDLKKYKSKVQHLQNQMIKANEREKQYLSRAPTRKELEENVRHLQEKQKKAKKLEDTCVQQEKVIQKMEKLLNKYMKNSTAVPTLAATAPPAVLAPDNSQQGTVSMLSQENSRLQVEIDRMRIHQQQYGGEKADLVARLERAESRVTSLESQLEHNSRAWAKERHELTVRLHEHRNGIVRTSGPRTSMDAMLDSYFGEDY